jgi:hypothetical protein
MTSLSLEVVYETGEAPFVGTIPSNGKNYWDITKENLEALFAGRTTPVTVTVPTTLAEMTEIPAQAQATWTIEEILALAAAHRKTASTATTGSFFIVFVKGYLDNAGAADTNVIGVSLSGTTVIAIFKDVVESTGANPAGPIPKFVEQSTIVHEMGHALGLVNNGVPPAAAHQDEPHGKHCTNPNCVLYYLNEGKTDLAAFVVQFTTTSSLVMFGQECLDDVAAYQP